MFAIINVGRKGFIRKNLLDYENVCAISEVSF